MKKTIYSYYLSTESGDEILKISEKNYKGNAIEFMKDFANGEYEAWKDEGYEDDDIPYNTFLYTEYAIEL